MKRPLAGQPPYGIRQPKVTRFKIMKEETQSLPQLHCVVLNFGKAYQAQIKMFRGVLDFVTGLAVAGGGAFNCRLGACEMSIFESERLRHDHPQE